MRCRPLHRRGRPAAAKRLPLHDVSQAIGHVFASTEVKKTDLTITGAVTWYQSSEKVRRGFCATCGSSLFWDPPHRDWIAVAMGAFDGPTGTRMNLHIFVAEKGDYYTISDGLPQNEH